MLTPLGRVLGGWRPGNGRAKSAREQALGAILELWPSIVGDDVAQHTRPVERSRDALLVLTSSSAWSNQLSLLTGHIVCALNDAGIDGIERLRFRVGRIRRAATVHGSEHTNGKAPIRSATAPEASSTAEEALSRFRERAALERDAKRADGWNPCSTCGAMLPKGTRCAPCTSAELSARSARVQRLMFEVPWLGFSGISALVEGLTHAEYETNRSSLLARWWETLERTRKTGKLSKNGLERQIASSYLLLKTTWEPDRITPVIARNELGDELYELLYQKYHDR
ncbi:MAG: DUF721 domain-containing protein [Candidatus Eremiobacteraeota bacterium]|nr:DUF721 domain-containing protein [Candidatus Eremiobacteraeota bacterium]